MPEWPWTYYPPVSFEDALGTQRGAAPHCFEFYQGIGSDLREEMHRWCQEHCEQWHSLGGSFYFYREDDAFAFKMRWL